MARRSREVGIIKSCILGAAFAGALAMPAQANELTLSATTAITTDYIFRGISNSAENPAVQPEFDAYYGIFYAGIWGSNTSDAIGDGIEIDYYAGIAPAWQNITFDIAGLYYTYPGGNDIDYFELKTGATWAPNDAWSFRVTNYWSPDYAQTGLQSDAIEGAAAYTFSGTIFNFFTPTISALVGWQWYEDPIPDYTYWNAGLTLGFMEHWSVDVRYWDTDYNQPDCLSLIGDRSACDARVVGTVKATF
ncbi:MAG: TorF family putative porin [Methyloceanibacter sp.]|uniref:TorF family putative porin n=1 Tax=Methyloceanibacter sp. TaxID=1965321 RepID=UPI003D6C90AB